MPNEKAVDYIQASISISEAEFAEYSAEKIPPIKFYKRGYRLPSGFRYYFGNPNTKKALLIASGTALENERASGVTDKEICEKVYDMEGKVTRIDYAITQYNEDDMITLDDMQQYMKDGLIDSSLVARGGKLISGIELDGAIYPETFYIGDLKKRGKKGIFRAYDKGFELDIERYLIVRLELEERGENANNSAIRLAQGHDISAVYNSRFSVRSHKWEKIMGSESVPLERGKAKKKDNNVSPLDKKWTWLIEQVAPVLRDAIKSENLEAGKSDRLSQFIIAAGLRDELMNAAGILADWKKIE